MPAVPDSIRSLYAGIVGLMLATPLAAGPLLPPGDLLLRHDVERLGNAGKAALLTTTWPLSQAGLQAALDTVDAAGLDPADSAAYARLRQLLQEAGVRRRISGRLGIDAAANPRMLRTFENTVRDAAAVRARFDGRYGRLTGQLNVSAVANPGDGDALRLDGTAIGIGVGNWSLSAGWEERWWGPGYDGSLILSTNARPFPALSLNRAISKPFESPVLRWLGPWHAAAFVGWLDDDRVVDDTKILGFRFAFRPVESLELGLSRTAQWCGDGRPCAASTLVDLLLGKDNRGVNVDPANEPGNQLAGFDVRWSLPRLPASVYAQWIGEDSRRGGPEIGSWLRLAGVEAGGSRGDVSYRVHAEVAETSCRAGGFGASEQLPDCAYEHQIYESGYRYRGRAIGHGLDGDGLGYSVGAVLVQSSGHAWFITARLMEINRVGQASARHTLSPLGQDRMDLQISHRRDFAGGVLDIGAGILAVDDRTDGASRDATAWFRWSTQ